MRFGVSCLSKNGVSVGSLKFPTHGCDGNARRPPNKTRCYAPCRECSESRNVHFLGICRQQTIRLNADSDGYVH